MNKHINQNSALRLQILLTTESKEVKYNKERDNKKIDNKDKEYDHLGLFKTKEHKQYLFKK